MRISDWSSDVCSSDLEGLGEGVGCAPPGRGRGCAPRGPVHACRTRGHGRSLAGGAAVAQGRAVPRHPRAHAGQRHYRSDEQTSALQSLMRNLYAVICLKSKTQPTYSIKSTTTTKTTYQ